MVILFSLFLGFLIIFFKFIFNYLNDDCTENGINDLNKNCSLASNMDLSERKHNYAFEGESIHWNVLVVDKNKIEDVTQ